MTVEQIGKYKISGHVGRGGMADVYKALHPELNRVVALKVLNRALLNSPEMLARFRREARAIAALRHPNIVQVFDLDVADGVYFMVMEFIGGETLNQRLARLRRRKKQMPLHEMLQIMIDVGEALHYAHEQEMLHRDIKPANIMFREDGGVVLTDFGVAKILNAASDITVSGAVAGTPAFMAPEQWTDDEPDRRSDIYSLGVVLYQVVTGELPFNAETPGRLMFKHLSEPPPLPRKLCADIPLELERVILRALAKDPQDRYQTARELVDDLIEVAYEVESTAPTDVFQKLTKSVTGAASKEQKSAQASRARPLLGLGVGAVLVLVTLIVVFASGLIGSTNSASTLDATGTAMAMRLAALEATLTVTPTPSQAPASTPGASDQTPMATKTPSSVSVETPSPAAIGTPSLSPSPRPSSEVCGLAMTVLQDGNYSTFNWWGTVNARFEKAWRLRNDGDCPWPQDVVLVHLDGEAFSLDEPFEVGSLPAGEDIELLVPLQIPDTPGQYEGRFQLQTPAGEAVGGPLAIKLEARSTSAGGSGGPVRFAGFDLIEWSEDAAHNIWRGKVRMWAEGGTGQYVWYRDSLDNPLPGSVLEFEWGLCRDFFGSVWVTSGDTSDHEGLYVPYPGNCN